MSEAQVAKSMDEIAALVASNTLQMRGVSTEEETPSPNEVDQSESVNDDTIPDDDNLDDSVGDDDTQTPEEGQDDSEVQSGDEDQPDREADEADSDVQDQQHEEELELVLADTDEVELDNGETITFGDLKKLYKADENILQATKEADDTRQEVFRMRAKAQEDSVKAQQVMAAMFQEVEKLVSMPLVPAPQEALKNSNPEQYIRHLEAYNKDQERIGNAKSQLLQAVEAHTQLQAEQLETRKAEELAFLVEKVPALKSDDVKIRTEASQDIINAAQYYGFTPNEVEHTADHRMFQMAHDAMQYRKLMDKSGKETEQEVEQTKQKVRQRTRTLRSQGTSAKSRQSSAAKQHKRLVSAAKRSGHVDDVAAMLVSNAKMRSRK